MDIPAEIEVLDWRSAPKGDYAVIGDPIAHTLSPVIHHAAYQAHGLKLQYRAVRVPPGDFSEAMARLIELGYQGVNVTLPLKELAFAWCKDTVAGVDRLGAVNTISLSSQIGTNTDAPAFIDTLKRLKIEPPARLLVLGAGGTAKAILVACAEAGFGLKVWNRTRSRMTALIDQIGIRADVVDEIDPSGCKAIINLTSASLHGEPLPVHWDWADPDTVTYEAAYGTELSPFLLRAKRHGLPTVDGITMLVEQAALAFEWWTGLSAPRRDMLVAIHERLEPNT